MNWKNLRFVLLSFAFGLLGGVLAISLFYKNLEENYGKTRLIEKAKTVSSQAPTGIQARFPGMQNLNCACLQKFEIAAEKARRAVVNIKTEYYTQPDLMAFLFGAPMQVPQIKGTGSGVIISPDGYIVTNNHVIQNATDITVTLFDKRTFKAKVIGTDPQTDIALIKIDAKNLPVLPFGNSDDLKVGQWVLAIGNPFNLTSTVTAGIISAKGRSVSIMDRRYAIESFIQTDAAINPGNSGGALVDLNGDLVGINTAIASPTGVFAGYGFAVPVNLVRKVVADLLEYGAVQRAYLGVKVTDVTPDLVKKYNLSTYQGVLVVSVAKNGAAKAAGIQPGDVITAVDGYQVTDVPELLEKIGQHRPGDKVNISVIRGNKQLNFEVTLRNKEGNTNVIVNERLDILGATFENLTPDEKQQLGIKYGVKVVDLGPGKLRAVGVQPGFIIMKINDKPIHSVKELKKIIDNIHGGVYIQGIYPDGTVAYYAFGIR